MILFCDYGKILSEIKFFSKTDRSTSIRIQHRIFVYKTYKKYTKTGDVYDVKAFKCTFIMLLNSIYHCLMPYIYNELLGCLKSFYIYICTNYKKENKIIKIHRKKQKYIQTINE